MPDRPMDRRVRAAEAWIKALRTGEASATTAAAAYLAPDVVLETSGAHMWGNGHEEFQGYTAVLEMITGIGVMTGVYRGGAWADPVVEDTRVRVTADLGGGLLASSSLTFSFDEQGRISRVEQVNTPGASPPATDRIPDFVKGIVNSALANNTPMIVAYTDESGSPVLSFRGSTQVYSDTQLSIWVRHATGGMIGALNQNPRMALMYRDPHGRTTLTFQGRAHVETSAEVRDRVFELAPEVEQKHDLQRHGAALIIDVERVSGNTPRGGVRMQRPASPN
ncbi:MAG TPA: pyridoxamine 5'-phosphate oxidase family protein [Chloroflexota bacterium]|nr:pyridoxamine 5'-phosphate oxidase family protein [Chloroflexota bacterium]